MIPWGRTISVVTFILSFCLEYRSTCGKNKHVINKSYERITATHTNHSRSISKLIYNFYQPSLGRKKTIYLLLTFPYKPLPLGAPPTYSIQEKKSRKQTMWQSVLLSLKARGQPSLLTLRQKFVTKSTRIYGRELRRAKYLDCIKFFNWITTALRRKWAISAAGG